MPHVKANEIQIHYEETGQGEPLILIHGLAQNSLYWTRCIPHLKDHFRVITIDLRGSGDTDAPEESYSISLMAQDIEALMDALSIPSANFIGVSMGTLVLQELCITHVNRVKKAILCAPFAHLPAIARHNLKMQIKLMGYGVPLSTLRELNIPWLLSEKFISLPGNVERFLEELLHDPFPITMEGVMGQIDALLEADFRNHLDQITQPLLLLAAEQDIDTPVWCAREIQQKAANADLHIFKEMGHMFLYEIPDKAMKKALQWLLR